MESNTRSSQADAFTFSTSSPKGNVSCSSSSSKEKKILQGRRQQRHSTEIGSEYHRWWVVRNALGFETNEHIAGLLLDGFHGLLHQLVVMCGGETYQPSVHGVATAPCDSNNCLEDLTLSASSSSSTSPPGGIENMDEFLEYKNAVTHYCDSLWRICCQQSSQLQQLDKASQPVQEFLIRLMGYLRTAKGKSFCINPKKRQLKPNSVRVKNAGEESSSQASIAKLCPSASSAQHESHSSVIPTSNQAVLVDMTRVLSCDPQKGWTEKCMLSSSDLSKNTMTQARDDIEMQPTGQTASTENVDTENKTLKNAPTGKYSYEDLNSNSLFLMQHQLPNNKQKEQTNVKHNNVSYSSCVQSDVNPGNHFKNTNLNHSPTNQRHLNQHHEASHPVSCLPPLHHRESSQQGSLVVQEADQQGKHSQQGNKLPDKLEVCTAKCEQPSEFTPRDTQNSLGSKQTGTVDDKDKSIHWSNRCEENHVHPGTGPNQDTKNVRPQMDTVFKVCGNTSSIDAAITEDKSDGELGFLLTDPLKMLPCIDEEIRYSPQSHPLSSVGGEKTNAERLLNPTDLKASSIRTAVPERQVQNSQTNVCMILPTGKMAASRLVTSRAQSLLPNMDIPKHKAKETQTVGANTSFYNEFKINGNNPRRVNEVKSQKVTSNTSLQPIQPAVFSGVDKPSSMTASLGTPVILYPARSFSSNDNSLASLSSLVHNIVYSSYGTILKPLSLTSLASSVSYSTPYQLSPPLSVSTVDSCLQKKPIAAALPVLSSQLSTGKPTLVPFYISHTAVNTLANISQFAGLSGPPGNIHNLSESQTTTQPHYLHQQQPGREVFTSASMLQDRSFGSQTSFSHVSSPLNMLQVTDIHSCSSTDFVGIGQVKHDTFLSQASNSTPGISQEIGQKVVKSNTPVQFSQNISVKNTEGEQQDISQQQFDSLLKQNVCTNIKPAVTAAYDHPEYLKPSCYNRHMSGSQSVCLEKILATSSTLAQSDQQVPSIKSTSKILNSLLASKEVGCNRGTYNSNQVSKSNLSVDSLSSTENTHECMDLKEGSKTADTSSLPVQETISHKSSSELKDDTSELNDGVVQNASEQNSRVVDFQSTSKPRPLSGMSQKSSRLHRLFCPACHALFFSSMDLLVHRFEQHGHVCGECDSRFLTLSRLKQHKQADHPPILMCSQCRFYTFKKEDLADHKWSEHGVSRSVADHNQTEKCCLPDDFKEEKTDMHASVNTGTLMHKMNQDCSIGLCDKPSDATTAHLCPDEVCDGSNKPSSLAKMKESVRATAGRFEDSEVLLDSYLHATDCKKELKNKGKCEKEPDRKDLIIDNELDSPSIHPDQTCSGSVFPSFIREASATAQPDLDAISAVYSQVSQHCQLDTTDFLHLSDNEEPRLVIDTDSGCYKEGCMDTLGLQDEKVLQNNDPGNQVSSVVGTKGKDVVEKLSDAASCTGQVRHKTASPKRQHSLYSDSLCQSEITCDASPGEDLRDKDSVISLQADGKRKILPESVGRERERLVMSISIKRRSSTPAYGRQSRRKKRTKSNRNGRVYSSNNVPSVEVDNPGNENTYKSFYISKSSFSKKNDCCKVPVTSCDQAFLRPNNDTCEISCGAEFCQLKASITDSYIQSAESIQKNFEHLDIDDAAKKQLGRDSSHLEKLHINSLHGTGDDIGGFKMPTLAEKVLSLQERHVMSSLPPKKRKLKKSSRASRDTSKQETPSNSQSVNNGILETDGAVSDISETQSLIRTAHQVSKTTEKKIKTKHAMNEQPGTDGSIIAHCQKRLSLHIPGSLETNVDSEMAKNEPELAELGQLLKVSSGRFECPVSSCKVSFGRRWNMKDHLTKVHARSSAIICSVVGCELKFSNKRELRQHITVDHMGKTRKYMCNWPDCSKGFFARTHLSIHMLTHTGEKPVACHICDYRCRQRTALIWHLRKHGLFHKAGNVKN